mgnify:CR=1 FL=1
MLPYSEFAVLITKMCVVLKQTSVFSNREKTMFDLIGFVIRVAEADASNATYVCLYLADEPPFYELKR